MYILPDTLIDRDYKTERQQPLPVSAVFFINVLPFTFTKRKKTHSNFNGS